MMTTYKHFVSGFFEHQDQVDHAVAELRAQQIPLAQIHVIHPDKSTSEHTSNEDSNHVLKDVLVDGAAGAAVGTGVGIAAEIALITANVSLFAASPIIAPLVLLGWGAGLGGFLGAAIGASKKSKPFLALVEDAIKNGQQVLIVETYSEQETALAQQIIKSLIGDYQESTQRPARIG
jgi:hypothetical protein